MFALLVFQAVSEWLDPTAALGVGMTLGLGGVCAAVTRLVPQPHTERLGLRGFPAKFWVPILFLVPITLVASEVDNWANLLAPPPDAAEIEERVTERLPHDTPLAIAESLIVAVGLAPVIEEWLFRGIIQQGAIARFGVGWGILFTAALFGVGHVGPGVSAAAWLASISVATLYGFMLGILRQNTRSLLAPIALHMGINASAVLGMVFAEPVPIAGFNAPGDHTPSAYLFPAAISVLIGWWLVSRWALPPVEIPEEEPTQDTP